MHSQTKLVVLGLDPSTHGWAWRGVGMGPRVKPEGDQKKVPEGSRVFWSEGSRVSWPEGDRKMVAQGDLPLRGEKLFMTGPRSLR